MSREFWNLSQLGGSGISNLQTHSPAMYGNVVSYSRNIEDKMNPRTILTQFHPSLSRLAIIQEAEIIVHRWGARRFYQVRDIFDPLHQQCYLIQSLVYEQARQETPY